MNGFLKYFFLFILLAAISGCTKPYSPPEISSPGSYLIVEGFINSGTDSTVIKLSRTVSLSNTGVSSPELHAVVAVESNKNVIYPLTETGNGNYASAGLNLNSANTYRLSIKTASNVQYYSDFEPVVVTPPIDSVGYQVQSNGIQVYLNTHDPAGNVKYYRWDYKETWQFHAEYQSLYVSNGTAIVPRTSAQMVYSCFGNDTASNILLGSSAALSEDVIYKTPITQIASASEKLETKYSIQVNQYALTGDAYSFWQNLKKNTEQLGSIFDAQPSQINGNIHCQNNPLEPVIGYISVSTVQRKRIFISNAQLPRLPQWNTVYPYTCSVDTDLFCRPEGKMCQNDVALFLIPAGSIELPIDLVTSNGNGPPSTLGYSSSNAQCVNCTIRGTTLQPGFWK
jgi:hypothetical protein